MLNKKILAASIGAALSMNAFAAVDLDDSMDTGLVYASETITSALTDSDGFVTVTSDNITADADLTDALDISFDAQFAIPISTTRFVRIELTNAEFETDLADGGTEFNGNTTGLAVSLLTGGKDGDTFAIYQLTTDGTNAVTSSTQFGLELDDLAVSESAGSASIAYTMHADLGDAAGGTGALVSSSGTVLTFSSIVAGAFTVAEVATATVSSGFSEFENVTSITDEDVGRIGSVDFTNYLSTATALDIADSATVDVENAAVLDQAQVIEFGGDFTVGDWNTATNADCTTGSAALTLNSDETTASTASGDFSMGSTFLCVDNSTTTAFSRGSYTATLVDDELTATIGSIIFDTTAIQISYLTTFADYNQRVYIINNGASDANYSTTFIAEDGVTAVAGDGATGTVPAGEMVAIRATDIVTLTGRTRTSATIEIEANEEDLQATTQTVNLSDGSTDTVILNLVQESN